MDASEIEKILHPHRDAVLLLAQVEELIRTIPPNLAEHTADVFSWLGRTKAVLDDWKSGTRFGVDIQLGYLEGLTSELSVRRSLLVMLYEARTALQIETGTSLNLAVGTGEVFDYFAGLRDVLTAANSDLLVIDRYLESTFLSTYLIHVPKTACVRLLVRDKAEALAAAARLFSKQYGHSVEVRQARDFHDRYVIVDGDRVVQSGASFKDGGKTAPTTLTEIVDARTVVRDMYEQIWSAATPVVPP